MNHVVLLFLLAVLIQCNGKETIDFDMVEHWAKEFGSELKKLSTIVVQRDKVVKSFSEIDVSERKGESLVQEVASKLSEMAAIKQSAVERIVKEAEDLFMLHHGDNVTKLQFYDMKQELALTPSRRFYGTPVDMCNSAVYVPVNVNFNVSEILTPIKWSIGLDKVFAENYARDPSLSWQYFGSSTGFIRQFPAMKWREEIPDLYDCRTRPWYVQAASGPKDLVILVDNSGSMKGLRSKIARQIVNHILDTLSDNDFVNVFNYTDYIQAVVPCFSNKTLVQANLVNVLTFKEYMKTLIPKRFANLTNVLPAAFELLREYRVHRKGACCNQAIMLITDGVHSNHREVFKKYNWEQEPTVPVRVFTYLTGDQIPDTSDIKWMACENRGYFVQVSTKQMSEVKDEVLKYVPVMARPMVLQKTEHPVNWTPMYADLEDINLNATHLRWLKMENERQADFYYHRRDHVEFSRTTLRKRNRFPVYVYKRPGEIQGET